MTNWRAGERELTAKTRRREVEEARARCGEYTAPYVQLTCGPLCSLIPAMMIWDVHCHLSGVPGRTPDERMAQLIAFADRVGIERICVFMGMTWSYDPTPDDMRQQNDEVLAALERWQIGRASCRERGEI